MMIDGKSLDEVETSQQEFLRLTRKVGESDAELQSLLTEMNDLQRLRHQQDKSAFAKQQQAAAFFLVEKEKSVAAIKRADKAAAAAAGRGGGADAGDDDADSEDEDDEDGDDEDGGAVVGDDAADPSETETTRVRALSAQWGLGAPSKFWLVLAVVLVLNCQQLRNMYNLLVVAEEE